MQKSVQCFTLLKGKVKKFHKLKSNKVSEKKLIRDFFSNS